MPPTTQDPSPFNGLSDDILEEVMQSIQNRDKKHPVPQDVRLGGTSLSGLIPLDAVWTNDLCPLGWNTHSATVPSDSGITDQFVRAYCRIVFSQKSDRRATAAQGLGA